MGALSLKNYLHLYVVLIIITIIWDRSPVANCVVLAVDYFDVDVVVADDDAAAVDVAVAYLEA